MRKLLATLTRIAAVVGALLVVATLVGLALPRAHRLTRTQVYPHPPSAVWAAVGPEAVSRSARRASHSTGDRTRQSWPKVP